MGLRSASSAVIPIIIVFIFFINFSLVSSEKNVCGEDSQPNVFRKITSCETLRFSRDYSKTCCPDNLKTAINHLDVLKIFYFNPKCAKTVSFRFSRSIFSFERNCFGCYFLLLYFELHVNNFISCLLLGARCAPNTFDGERCLYAALTDKIRSLLKSYKAITSECMRRDSYREFLRR